MTNEDSEFTMDVCMRANAPVGPGKHPVQDIQLSYCFVVDTMFRVLGARSEEEGEPIVPRTYSRPYQKSGINRL